MSRSRHRTSVERSRLLEGGDNRDGDGVAGKDPPALEVNYPSDLQQHKKPIPSNLDGIAGHPSTPHSSLWKSPRVTQFISSHSSKSPAGNSRTSPPNQCRFFHQASAHLQASGRTRPCPYPESFHR